MDTLVEPQRLDIQGYLLSAYGHLSCSAFVFLNIQNAADARSWLREIIPITTTARIWPTGPDGRKIKPPTAVNIAFSHPGFHALELPLETLQSFPQEFIEGEAARSEVLRDIGNNSPEFWEFGGPDTPPLHVILILYAGSAQARDELLDRQRRILDRYPGIVEVRTEKGDRPSNEKEQFGFHDGLGQPAIDGVSASSVDEKPNNRIKLGELVLGYLNGYDMYQPSPNVLTIHDPDGLLPPFPEGGLPNCRDFGRNGSYLVFRKLEQDVAGFWNFVQQNAGPQSHEMIRLASKFIGRWPSGTPLSLSPTYDNPAFSETDEFSFMANDPDGYRCPVGSHIRRANPRDSLQNDTPAQSYLTNSRHRIVRRGISFGEPLFPLDMLNVGRAPVDVKDDGRSRGEHFIALNASIARQFEFIQQTWCNDAEFHALYDIKDPIVGGNDGTGGMAMPAKPYRKFVPNLPQFVRVRGGAYFFMPSMPSLRYMARN